MTDLLMYDLGNHSRVLRGGYIAVRYSTGGIVRARNEAVRMFVDSAKSDWLFWVDTDMGFAPDTLERLLEAADPDERPIVGALCFGFKEQAPDGMGGYWSQPIPTVLDWKVLPSGEAGFAARFDYERDAVVKCSGTGAACIVIHRSVFDKLGPNPYEPLLNPTTDEPLGEDLSFCALAASHDIPVHVHTGVHTSHLKPIWVGQGHLDIWPIR